MDFFADCYQAIQWDYNLDQSIVRDTIRVTGLVKCEEACTDTKFFACRSFAFSTSLSASFNCYLSDRSKTELGITDLVKDFDSIIYEKQPFCGNYNYNYKGYKGLSDGKYETHY